MSSQQGNNLEISWVTLIIQAHRYFSNDWDVISNGMSHFNQEDIKEKKEKKKKETQKEDLTIFLYSSLKQTGVPAGLCMFLDLS